MHKKPALKHAKQPEQNASQLKQFDSMAEDLLKAEITRGGPAPGLMDISRIETPLFRGILTPHFELLILG